MIGIFFLTCLTFFPASCHLIGDVGPPPELMAGDTGGGNEGYIFRDVKKCELQSENLAVELNPKETHTYDLTLRMDGELLPSHLVKDETAVVATEISLQGQRLTCTAGIGKVIEKFGDAVADIEGIVISTMQDGKLIRFFNLQWGYMDKSYVLEPRASKLTGCRDMESPAKSLLKGTFLLYGQEHYLFDVTNSGADGSSGNSSPISQNSTPPSDISTPRTSFPPTEVSTPTTSFPPSDTSTPSTSFPPSEVSTPTTSFPPSDTSTPSTSFPPSDTSTPSTSFPPSEVSTPSTSFPPSDTSTPSTSFPPSEVSTPSTSFPPSNTSTPSTSFPPTQISTPITSFPPSQSPNTTLRTTTTNRPTVTPPDFIVILCVVASGCMVVIAMVLCCKECKKVLCGEKKSKGAKETPTKR